MARLLLAPPPAARPRHGPAASPPAPGPPMRFYFQVLVFLRSQQVSGHSGDLSWAGSRVSQPPPEGKRSWSLAGTVPVPAAGRMVPGGPRCVCGGVTRCWQGWGSPKTCFLPQGEGAFAGAAVAGAGQAPGSSCRGFPRSGLTWAGAVWPLPWPAACKNPTVYSRPGPRRGRPARAPCGSAACSRWAGSELGDGQAVPWGCRLPGSGWSPSCAP